MERVALLDMLPDELAAFFKDMGEPAFRAKQVYTWLRKGAQIDEMTNVPKKLRLTLSERCTLGGARIHSLHPSSVDHTKKFLFALEDGNIVEGVLMEYSHGNTLCISTQVGCRMGCAFCASTIGGLVRNMTAGEILGEVLSVNRAYATEDGSRAVTNIVLMGSGEPLDNYDNVVRFLRLVTEPGDFCISPRNISLSTSGLVPKMLRLAQEAPAVTLSVSLHAPNDTIRKKLMPISHKYSVTDVLGAARVYAQQTGRRVIIEYILIKDVNDSLLCAHELSARLRSFACHVNLIPVNPIKESNFVPPDKAGVLAFERELTRLNTSVTVRREMGRDIQGACGQLRRDTLFKIENGGDRDACGRTDEHR